MKFKTGDSVIPLTLPGIDGKKYELDSLKGKRYMLSFFRFAACPFCNMRVHELVKGFNQLGEKFTIIAVFDSPLDNLQRHADKHQAPFPILADENRTYYKAYGIENSIIGVLKGMFGRMPTLLKGMFLHGYIPLVIKGSMTTMPADFLVDENGSIHTAYYGKDEGDHLEFDRIKAFALGKEI